MFLSLLEKYLGVEVLGQVCSSLRTTAKLFSKVIVPFHILTSNVIEICLFHILINIWLGVSSFLLRKGNVVGTRKSCLPGTNPLGYHVLSLLYIVGYHFATILFRILAPIFIRDMVLQFSFLVMSISGFKVMLVHWYYKMADIALLFNFLKSLYRFDTISSSIV